MIGSIYGDNLYGNNQANTLIGGRGNDDFWAGDGRDTMDGGAGDDQFHYASLAALDGDRINGFTYGYEQDRVVLTGLGVKFVNIIVDEVIGGVLYYKITGVGPDYTAEYTIAIDGKGSLFPREEDVFTL
ncbi:hypothetical protein CU100_05530 [Phyllobacterium endophyticum]|uniref:Peptidase M10 serralysin C-terminal domain-containing protein n=1 Tax=Phyllobacterium endophyticum TaxID=1149773 RepID=A0A2P7B170_9HYPH|nr:hypothetical protein CU100_05530 [Phyllobacterium endophyticum]